MPNHVGFSPASRPLAKPHNAQTGRPSPPSGLHAGGAPALVAAIKADPRIQAAFSRWNTLSQQEKLAIGERISQLQGKAFGFVPTARPVVKELPGSTMGQYWSDGRLEIDPAPLSAPDRFLAVLIHERTHEMRRQKGLPKDHEAVYQTARAIRYGVFGTLQ